jgi:micrococcal nuclease
MSVSDGDTMTASCGGTSKRIRVASIDAPEKDQAYGPEATQATAQLVLDRDVVVEVEDVDRYGRSVARVRLADGADLARELVGRGAAWHYVQYSRDPELAVLETAAREARLGLWADAAPIQPSAFRQSKRAGFQAAAGGYDARARWRLRRSERRSLVRGR